MALLSVCLYLYVHLHAYLLGRSACNLVCMLNTIPHFVTTAGVCQKGMHSFTLCHVKLPVLIVPVVEVTAEALKGDICAICTSALLRQACQDALTCSQQSACPRASHQSLQCTTLWRPITKPYCPSLPHQQIMMTMACCQSGVATICLYKCTAYMHASRVSLTMGR